MKIPRGAMSTERVERSALTETTTRDCYKSFHTESKPVARAATVVIRDIAL
jgi:hypothetical protein